MSLIFDAQTLRPRMFEVIQGYSQSVNTEAITHTNTDKETQRQRHTQRQDRAVACEVEEKREKCCLLSAYLCGAPGAPNRVESKASLPEPEPPCWA